MTISEPAKCRNAQHEPRTAMRPHDTFRGKILYTSRKPERRGAERGREHFTITRPDP